MQKHNRRGRAYFGYSIRLETLLLHALHDMGRFTDCSVERNLLATQGVRALYTHVCDELAFASSQESDIKRYICLRQIHAFLHKNTELPGSTPAGRRLVARRSFHHSELRNRIVNRRLSFYQQHWSRAPLAASILNEAALIIQGLLPPLTEVMDEILDNCSFGPGVTTASASFAERALYFKVSGRQTMTKSARPVFLAYAARNPGWLNRHPDVLVEETQGDRVTFVPKSSKTDRTIAIQPSLNLFLQKGVEHCLVRLLRRVGVTLHSQERNGQAASRGSVDGSLATVDLSAASDSISIELVRWLVPADWFSLLDALRTRFFTEDKGATWQQSSKFSAMGNAFTFPLESLIFWAIVRAVMNRLGSRGEWRVYGDDIVVPTNCYALLTEVFRFAGFRVNTDKSFVFGSFRESCGYDFVRGFPVRPVYVKGPLRSVESVYNLYNRLLLSELRIPFPSLLAYLRESVQKAHIGPIEQSSRELGYWASGLNPMLDSYFISDPPNDGVWCEELHCRTWTVSVLARRYKKLRDVDEISRLSLLLLFAGVEDVDDLSRPVLFDRKVNFTSWPRLRDVLACDVKQGQDPRDARLARNFVPVAVLHKDYRETYWARIIIGLADVKKGS